jgi:hypothetical protein
MEVEKCIEMTTGEIRRCTEDVFKAMNDAQMVKGFTVDQVLMAVGYALGASIYSRGGRLDLDAPLRAALPPLVSGYEHAKKNGLKAKPFTD